MEVALVLGVPLRSPSRRTDRSRRGGKPHDPAVGPWQGHAIASARGSVVSCFFFQAEDGIRYHCVTGVQTCALPILRTVEPRHRKLKARDNPYGSTFMYLVSKVISRNQSMRSNCGGGRQPRFPQRSEKRALRLVTRLLVLRVFGLEPILSATPGPCVAVRKRYGDPAIG